MYLSFPRFFSIKSRGRQVQGIKTPFRFLVDSRVENRIVNRLKIEILMYEILLRKAPKCTNTPRTRV